MPSKAALASSSEHQRISSQQNLFYTHVQSRLPRRSWEKPSASSAALGLSTLCKGPCREHSQGASRLFPVVRSFDLGGPRQVIAGRGCAASSELLGAGTAQLLRPTVLYKPPCCFTCVFLFGLMVHMHRAAESDWSRPVLHGSRPQRFQVGLLGGRT